MEAIRITTNRVPRDVVEGYELSADERERFDYLDWARIDDGRESASFFRYRGETYDLAEFAADWGISKGSGLPVELRGWDGYMTDSYFSGMVVRYVEGMERVVVGRLLVCNI